MGIHLNYGRLTIEGLRASIEDAKREVYDVMCASGDVAIEHCRNLTTYEDQSGNLRASIGIAPTCDGKAETSVVIGGKPVGEAEGKKACARIGQEKAEEGKMTVTLTAGMEYGYYLEHPDPNNPRNKNRRPIDVIGSGALVMNREFEERMKTIFD